MNKRERDTLTLELLSNMNLKWKVPVCITPVSLNFIRNQFDRNNRACSHNTLLDSAVSVLGTWHFRHAVDAKCVHASFCSVVVITSA